MDTQDILSVKLTGNDEDDASVGSYMLQGQSRIKSFKGDGAYDKFGFREILGVDVEQIIPPPKNAVVCLPTKNKSLPNYLIQRNKAEKDTKTKELRHVKNNKGLIKEV